MKGTPTEVPNLWGADLEVASRGHHDAPVRLDRNKLRASRLLHSRPPEPSVYWHSELPPLDAEPMGEHIAEAASARVPHTLAHRDELWKRCCEDLMVQARNRLKQEIARLGGDCAQVLDEHVESKYDVVRGESCLQGWFRYIL
jgi:hypothetical protein